MRITNPYAKALVSGIEQYRHPVNRSLDALAPSNGANRVRYIDNRMAKALVEELAPKVRDAMPGFQLDTSRVSVNVQSRTQAHKTDTPLPFHLFTDAQWIAYRKRIGGPMTTFQRTARWFRNVYWGAHNQWFNHVDKRLGIAHYNHDKKHMMLCGKSARALSWNGLREIVFHELVHAAQDQTYPALMQSMSKDMDPEIVRALVDPKRKARLSLIRGRKTLLEGHATFLESQYRKTLPEGRNNFRRVRTRLYVWTGTLFKATKEARAYYTEGFNFFRDVHDGLIPKALVSAAYANVGIAERYLSSPDRIVDARYWQPNDWDDTPHR